MGLTGVEPVYTGLGNQLSVQLRYNPMAPAPGVQPEFQSSTLSTSVTQAKVGAGDRTQTDGHLLGRQRSYQLDDTRIMDCAGVPPAKISLQGRLARPTVTARISKNIGCGHRNLTYICLVMSQIEAQPRHPQLFRAGKRNRTPDHLITSEALYQLSYSGIIW